MAKNIAVVCGGFSGEYDVSIQSGKLVASKLSIEKYNTYLIVITKDSWYHLDQNNEKHEINKDDFSLLINNERIVFDGVFNAIHGTPGEDGKLQGYFDILGIPHTSSDADVSALTFNKYLCNKFVNAIGITTAKSISIRKEDKYNNKEILEALGLPVFVKPSRSGSSVGVTKVNKEKDLSKAIDNAFLTDDIILIEEFLQGREFACGLFKRKNELVVLPLCEIKSKHEFFDYEAKYTKGLADEITPPYDLDIDKETDMKTLSAYIYNKMGCKGLIRIDYILTKNDLYFIEVNTIPGLSEASIVPKQANAMDISTEELFNTLTDNLFTI